MPLIIVSTRHRYLRDHLHGIEIDPFAREIARLSLTLADVPYGNSWRIDEKDMFEPEVLKNAASHATVLLLEVWDYLENSSKFDVLAHIQQGFQFLNKNLLQDREVVSKNRRAGRIKLEFRRLSSLTLEYLAIRGDLRL